MRNSQRIGWSSCFKIMDLSSRMVNSMAILDGENPKIQIGESELIDVRELILEGGFSVLDSSQNPNEIMIHRYTKNISTGLQIFSDSSKLLSTSTSLSSIGVDNFQDKKISFEAENSTSKTNSLASQIGNYLGFSAVLVGVGALSYLAKSINGDRLNPKSTQQLKSDSSKVL